MIISGKRTFLTNRRFWRIVVNVVVLTALLYFFQAGLASLFSQNYSIKFNWQYADSTDSFSLFYLQDNTWIQESQAPLSSPLSLSDDFLSSNVFVLKFDSKATKLSLETVDVFFNQQVIGSLDSGIIYDAIEDYQNIKFVENTDIPSLNFTLEPGAQITFNDIFSESIVNMISNHHYTYIFPSIAFFFFILSVFAVNHLAKLLSKYLKDTGYSCAGVPLFRRNGVLPHILV